MARRRISQREAREAIKRVAELENIIQRQRSTWWQEYFGGTEVARGSWQAEDPVPVAVRTARKLNHAVVAVGDDGGSIRFVALPQAKGGR